MSRREVPEKRGYRFPRIVHAHAHPAIPRVARKTSHLRVDRNDSSTAADVRCSAPPEKSFRSPCRECAAPASQPKCSEQAEELNCCDRTALGRKKEKCQLQKRTCWLLRLWVDGRISRRALPQKSAGTPSNSFEPFGRQQHGTPNWRSLIL
jgi:hypothetical protein